MPLAGPSSPDDPKLQEKDKPGGDDRVRVRVGVRVRVRVRVS